MTRYLPILFDIKGKKCLVIGGGNVAYRKVQSLNEHGAQVTVVAPELIDEIKTLAEQGSISILNRPVAQDDLDGMSLVFSATDDCELNESVAKWACDARIPINVVDNSELCTFIMPAILRRGSLQIAVSTGGEFPGLARRIRDAISAQIEENFADYISILGEIRRRIIESPMAQEEKSEKIEALCSKRFYRLFKEEGAESLKNALLKIIAKK